MSGDRVFRPVGAFATLASAREAAGRGEVEHEQRGALDDDRQPVTARVGGAEPTAERGCAHREMGPGGDVADIERGVHEQDAAEGGLLRQRRPLPREHGDAEVDRAPHQRLQPERA